MEGSTTLEEKVAGLHGTVFNVAGLQRVMECVEQVLTRQRETCAILKQFLAPVWKIFLMGMLLTHSAKNIQTSSFTSRTAIRPPAGENGKSPRDFCGSRDHPQPLSLFNCDYSRGVLYTSKYADRPDRSNLMTSGLL